MPLTFMTSCLRSGLVVQSLTAFSHRIFKHQTIVTKKYFTWKYPTLIVSSPAVRICSRSSYLLTFVDIFAYNQQLTFLTHPVCKTTRRVMWTGTLGNATSTAVVLRARVQRKSAYMFLLLHWSTAVVVGFHGAGPILRNFSGAQFQKFMYDVTH